MVHSLKFRLSGTQSLLPALLLLACAAAPAQTFPSDSRKPADADAALLAAACPGQAVSRPEPGCAAPCPGLAVPGRGAPGWSLKAVTAGHFLSPVSQDAALSVQGCANPAGSPPGTILLTQQSGKWTQLWYKPGVDTSNCHELRLRNSRELLACLSVREDKGAVATSVYVEDLLAPADSASPAAVIFSAVDDTAPCGLDGHLVRSGIDNIGFDTGNESADPIIIVAASVGKKQLSARELKECAEGRPIEPPHMIVHTLEFDFDGRGYRIAPRSARFLQMFSPR